MNLNESETKLNEYRITNIELNCNLFTINVHVFQPKFDIPNQTMKFYEQKFYSFIYKDNCIKIGQRDKVNH